MILLNNLSFFLKITFLCSNSHSFFDSTAINAINQQTCPPHVTALDTTHPTQPAPPSTGVSAPPIAPPSPAPAPPRSPPPEPEPPLSPEPEPPAPPHADLAAAAAATMDRGVAASGGLHQPAMQQTGEHSLFCLPNVVDSTNSPFVPPPPLQRRWRHGCRRC